MRVEMFIELVILKNFIKRLTKIPEFPTIKFLDTENTDFQVRKKQKQINSQTDIQTDRSCVNKPIDRQTCKPRDTC